MKGPTDRFGHAAAALVVLLGLVLAAAPGASGAGLEQVPDLDSVASRVSQPTRQSSPFPVTGFRVGASNGYTIHGVGYPAAALHLPVDLVYFTATGKHGSASYGVVGTVSAGRIAAQFGSLGSIDLQFHPSGETKTFRAGCGNQPYEGEGGRWEGTVDITGEGGYTAVSATRAAPTWLYGPDHCYSSSTGSGIEGVVLEARGPATFSAAQNKGRGTTVDFDAVETEDLPGMAITREVWSRGNRSSLTYPRSLSRASVRPPAPFGGHGAFRRSSNHPGRGSWTGNLKADFPGGPTVALAGPGFLATFGHGTYHQSH